MADLDGISFLRTTRAATPVIYGPDEEFPVGGAKVVRDGDDVTIVGAGITLHEALKAADALAEDGISARVIDLYSVKPSTRRRSRAAATTGRSSSVEDHWPEGGLGEAVLSALAGGRAPPSSTWPSARCPARASRPSCSPPRASTRTRSRRPRARSSTAVQA